MRTLLLFGLLTAVTTLQAQRELVISGKAVRGPNAQRVQITLMNENGNAVAAQRHRSGRFHFRTARDGSYTMRFKQPGCLTKEVVLDDALLPAMRRASRVRHIRFDVRMEPGASAMRVRYSAPAGYMRYRSHSGSLRLRYDRTMASMMDERPRVPGPWAMNSDHSLAAWSMLSRARADSDFAPNFVKWSYLTSDHRQPPTAMRTFVLASTAALFFTSTADAQLIAGEVPNGSTTLEPNINIALGTPFTADSASLEFDCDDFPDAWAVLFRGAPEIDAPNMALLRFVDTDIEVCADMGSSWQQRPKYHALGEPLDCAGNFNWQSANTVVLGDFGGFTAIGPLSVDSLYIAYRRGAQVGWILLSFEVGGGLDVGLQVHELLPLCPAIMSVGDETTAPGITLFPDPTDGEVVQVRSSNALRSIDVLDATGKLLTSYNGGVRTIDAPDAAGSYMVQAVQADGRRSVSRLIKY